MGLESLETCKVLQSETQILFKHRIELNKILKLTSNAMSIYNKNRYTMITTKKIKFEVEKPFGYLPINFEEKERIKKLIVRKIIIIANRFDGPSSFNLKL